MKLLFVGDVIGKPGRKALRHLLPQLVDKYEVDYTVVNVENSAGGFGVTAAVLDEIEDLGIDCLTSGNHIWDKREVLDLLDSRTDLLRPMNYPHDNPGRGVHIGQTAGGIKVATMNVEGQVFMKPLRSPFEAMDAALAALPDDVKIVLVDFHAEATSEKQALGFYLDGRATAVLGTHTHVPTADARILPRGTAMVTDVGMTGPYESVIGMRADKVLRRFLRQTPAPFEVAKRDIRLAAALVVADPESGRAVSVETFLLPLPEGV